MLRKSRARPIVKKFGEGELSNANSSTENIPSESHRNQQLKGIRHEEECSFRSSIAISTSLRRIHSGVDIGIRGIVVLPHLIA